MKEKDLIKKWLNNAQLTHTELEAFKNLNAYNSYVRISDTAKKFKAPDYEIEFHLEDLKTNLTENKSTSSPKQYITILTRVAAVFIIGISTYFALFYRANTTIDTLASQKTTIELPDHSIVKLNALSSIEYQEKKWDDNRKIKLKGEAYFKVARGKKFDVETSSGTVSVLGTEFNIKHRDHYFEVICYEGLVSVSYDNNIVKLPAGKTFKILKNVISKGESNVIQPDWIENKSVFSSTPYSHILKEFERQYNITIMANNIDQNKLFTGNFVHSDIQTAIQSITIPMRLKYKINDNNITLYKE